MKIKNRQEILTSLDFWTLELLNYSEEIGISEIKGHLKLEKLLTKVNLIIRRDQEEGWELYRNFKRPTNPGLSRLIQSYKDLGLIELKKLENKPGIIIKITEKGKRYLYGLKSFSNLIINGNLNNIKKIEYQIRPDINKSGEELLKDENISDLKKNHLIGEKI